MFNFADAPQQNDFSDLIPHGTLAHALLKIRRVNGTIPETQSATSASRYLDCEATITDGRHRGRKVFTKIGTGGKENYINMGRASIKAILEFGRGASPQFPQGYAINSYDELDNNGQGIPVGIKIKVDPAKEGYPEKNDVAVFLSPIADSGTVKDFERLLSGDTEPKAAPAAKQTAAVSAPAWTAGTTQAPAAGAQPTWLGSAQTTAPQPQPAAPVVPHANPTQASQAPVATQTAPAQATVAAVPTTTAGPPTSPSSGAPVPSWLPR